MLSVFRIPFERIFPVENLLKLFSDIIALYELPKDKIKKQYGKIK